MDQELPDAAAYAPGKRFVCIHRRGACTILREMTSRPPSWKYDVISKIWLRPSMPIYLKNKRVKCHPDPILNDRALGFLKRSLQQEEEQQE